MLDYPLTFNTRLSVIAACAAYEHLIFSGLLPLPLNKSRPKLNEVRMWANSIVHGLIATPCAIYAVFATHRASTLAEYTPPIVGVVGLCITVGHFLYDFRVIISVNCQPLVPMLAHHALSGGLMAWVVLGVPRAVWWACLLQCTEAIVPVQFALFHLERRGHDERRTVAYAAARWLQLVGWVVCRILVILRFGQTVYLDYPTLSPSMRVLGWVAGVCLGLFNFAGFLSVVLPGCPWSPRRGDKGD